MPFLEFLHCSGIIEQAELNATQQMFQVQHSFERKYPANGVSWLGTFVQPIECALAVELNGCGNCKWIVSTDLLDEFAVSWSAGVGYHDEIERSLLRPMSLQSDFNWHFK